MTRLHLLPTSDMKLLAKHFLNYSGNTFTVETRQYWSSSSDWDSGSKRDAVLVNRDGLQPVRTGRVTDMPIPANHFVIEHSTFQGRSMGITFLVRADELDTAMLPPVNEILSDDEKIVLIATKEFKSSYQGIKDFRAYEARRVLGITRERYNAAKQRLIDIKALNKAGAITNKGKNMSESLPYTLHMLKSVAK